LNAVFVADKRGATQFEFNRRCASTIAAAVSSKMNHIATEFERAFAVRLCTGSRLMATSAPDDFAEMTDGAHRPGAGPGSKDGVAIRPTRYP
jgi:hypothetical protein